MNTTLITNPPIVVGVDGSEHGLRAASWAAEIAAARHWALRLVHVHEQYHPNAPVGPGWVAVPRIPATTDIVDEARKHVGNTWPVLDVEAITYEGSKVHVLLDQLAVARMLVLGRRGAGRFAELVLGSTVLSCAARATGPVVVVPPTGFPATGDHVLLGLDGSPLGQAAIGLAFAEASARGVRLDVLTAWELPSPYAFDYASYTGAEAWKLDQELAVAELIAGWGATYPDVTVRTIIEQDHPASALVRHAASAALVVVGGRGHSPLADLLMGSTARAVIQHADCAVAVVHQPASSHSR